LRRLATTRAADAGAPIEGRADPSHEGARLEGAAAVPRVREEGAGGRFDQVDAQEDVTWLRSDRGGCEGRRWNGAGRQDVVFVTNRWS